MADFHTVAPAPWDGHASIFVLVVDLGLRANGGSSVMATREAAAINAMSSRHGTTSSISSRNTALRSGSVPVRLVSSCADFSATQALRLLGTERGFEHHPQTAQIRAVFRASEFDLIFLRAPRASVRDKNDLPFLDF